VGAPRAAPTAGGAQTQLEMQRVAKLVADYQAENQARPASEKKDVSVVASEIRTVLAQQRQLGNISTPIAVMVRVDAEGKEEPQIVIGVLDDQDLLREVSQVVDECISLHGTGKESPDQQLCDKINMVLKERFESGNLKAPANVTLSYDVEGKAQLEIAMKPPI